MSNPNLPAIPDPTDNERSLQPHVMGKHLVTEAAGGVSVAPLDMKDQELMQWRPTTSRKRDLLMWPTVVGIDVVAPHTPLPYSAQLAVAGLATLGAYGISIGDSIRGIRRRTQQKGVAKAAFAGEDACYLTNRWLGVDIPEGLLDTDVEYLAGTAVAKAPMHELLTSIGNTAPGFRMHAGEDDDTEYRQVSPGNLVTQAFAFIGDEHRDTFLDAAQGSLAAMHEAAKQLPPHGLMPRTPGSVREGYVRPAANLLAGALGTYATLRELAGPIVAERVRDHYGRQAEPNEPLLEDIVRLEQPTQYRVPWRTIEDFRDSVL